MQKFTIARNYFLAKPTEAYFHQYYKGFQVEGNPDFINTLKNTFANESKFAIRRAINQVKEILLEDLPQIPSLINRPDSVLCTCIPRAKAREFFTTPLQLGFSQAVREAANELDFLEDGKECIIRTSNTYTTHFRGPVKNYVNDGKSPYKGITKDSCYIDKDRIKGRVVLLVDDIYTITVNIDEDCIQALYDYGAKEVIFYAIAYTKRDA